GEAHRAFDFSEPVRMNDGGQLPLNNGTHRLKTWIVFRPFNASGIFVETFPYSPIPVCIRKRLAQHSKSAHQSRWITAPHWGRIDVQRDGRLYDDVFRSGVDQNTLSRQQTIP